MSTDKCTPYGVKTLLECLSRATLLAQPDDIPEFLSEHVGKIAQSRDNESRDIKEVAFQYQEQWENTVLAKERKSKETQRPAPEESCSPASSVSSTASACFIVSPPREVRQRTCRVSSVRIPSREDSVGEKISPSSEPRPVPPPCKETVMTCQVSSVRIPSQVDGVGLTTEEISLSREPRAVLQPPPPCVERVKTLQVSSFRIPSQEESVGLTTEEMSLSREPEPIVRPTPPCEERVKTLQVSSARIPSQEYSVGLTTEEMSLSSEPRPVVRPPPPTCGERVKTLKVLPVRIPSQKDSLGLNTEKISSSSEPRPVPPPPPCGKRVKTLQVSSIRIPSQEYRVDLTTKEISLSSEPRPVLQLPPPTYGERFKTLKVLSVRIPSQKDSLGLNTEKIPCSNTPRPVIRPPPPHGERVKTHQDSSVRIRHQKETKPSLPSAFPVLPPIPQKALSQVSKQVQGQKSTKGRRNHEYTCRLNDCPYHNKPKEEPQVERELEPVRSSTLPTVKFENSSAGLRISEIHIPYRPKGGPILDPELVPKRTKAGTVTNRKTGAESNLLRSRQDTANSRRGTVSWGTKNLDLSQESLECAIHTLPHLAHSVHIIRYRRTRVHCNELQPQSARLPDIDLAPNLQQVSRNSTLRDCSRSSSAMSNLPSSHFSY